MSPQHHLPSQTPITNEATTSIAKASEQSVPLHTLCQNCRLFCQTWEVLDWVQEDGRNQAPKRPSYYMCPVAHCLQFTGVCHLCTWLSAALERHRFADETTKNNADLDIYFHPVTKSGIIRAVTAFIGSENPMNLEPLERKFLGTFPLREYDLSQSGGFHEHITAREIPLHAKDNFKRAKIWITTCLSDHQDCHDFHHRTVTPHQRQRPTRVLDVAGNTIRLQCDMANEHFDYLVLSHMWGENHSSQLRLLSANLATFKREVPRTELETSTTFKEAVRLTRALGYRYLWIDSLCIIQDAPSDWEYEARRMAIVYGNAACNLAFLFPPGAGHDMGLRSDPRAWNPCILRPASASRSGLYIEHPKGSWWKSYYDHGRQNPWLAQRNWPLFGRAWTFQEYLLSSRTLLVGHQNLMWHCSHLFYDELLGRIAERHDLTIKDTKYTTDMGKSRYFPATLQTLATAPTLCAPSVLSFMIDWQSLINEYRSRRLSFAKDRVVAFAGIARAFGNLGDLTYLAGAWREVFPLCLLWYIDRKMTHVVRQENALENGPVPESTWTHEILESSPDNVPSWSWFAAPIYRFYQLNFLLADDELQVHWKSQHLPRPTMYFDDIYVVQGRQFQFGSALPPDFFPESAFFDFANLKVTLEMPVLPVRVSWPNDLDEQLVRIKENSTSDDDGEMCWNFVFEYYPDVPWGRKSPPRHAVYALLAEYQIVRTAGKYVVQRRLVGVMLVPGRQIGTWVRIGVWKLNVRISEIPVHVDSLTSVARRWQDYVLVSSTWQTECITLV